MKRVAIKVATSVLFLCCLTTFLTAEPQREASAIKHSKMVVFLGPPRQRNYLQVGPAQMEWSLRNTERKTGWVYFDRPESNDPIWEFAPCIRTNLQEVAAENFPVDFIRKGDPRVGSLFRPTSPVETGSPSTFRAIMVGEGQIVLARLVGSPSTVYAVKFAEQVGTPKWASIRIDYLELKVANTEPSGAASRSRPVGSETNRSSAAVGPGG